MSSSAASEDAEARAPTRVIPVICGPTASGKSAIVMRLAEKFPLLIINADSRQIYRGFDAGTAKPSAHDRLRTPHRGVDVVDPPTRFSAAEWVVLAQRAIGESYVAGRMPVIVGGTGFYISTLFKPLWSQPPLDSERRAAIQDVLAPMTTEELRRWCTVLDSARAHLGRAQLLRAVEVSLLTGERLSELHVARARPAAYAPSYLLVDPGPALASRIARRAQAMLQAGWPDEVRHLMGIVPAEAPAWHSTGYRVVRQYVTGDMDRDTALNRVVIETRQYAKRQRTWFRHQLERERVSRLNPDDADAPTIAEQWVNDIGERMSETQS